MHDPVSTLTPPIPARVYRPRLCALACWGALAVITLGCEAWNGAPPAPGYMPSWAEARISIETALTAWRDAPSPFPSSFDTGAVMFLDKRRRPNQRLRSFEILGERDVENARQFTVRLGLEGEETPQLVKYNIVGRDPVWVFRLEDYEMFSHWEHDMDAPAPRPAEELKDAGQSTKAK